MPRIPVDQRSPYATATATAAKRGNPPAETAPHQRQGDRAADDDDDSEAERQAKRFKAENLVGAKRVARRNRLIQSGFPILVRFDDLAAAGFVGSWTQLLRMIADEGFPAGTLLSANVRAWRLDELEAWLESRPSARKAVSPDAVHPRVRDQRRATAEAQEIQFRDSERS
jgi:hypothetical protein